MLFKSHYVGHRRVHYFNHRRARMTYARCRLRNTTAFAVLQPIGLYGTAPNVGV